MADRISIALATFNGARFLSEQLDSLASQSRLPDELVIADDGSTDNTLEIVEQFIKHAPFEVILLPSDRRRGYAQNFRRAVNGCSSDFIALCDQDDIWLSGKLRELEREFADPQIILAYHNARIFGAGPDAPLFPSASDEHASTRVDQAPFKIVCGLVQMFRADLRRFDDLWDRSLDHVQPGKPLAHDQWYFFLAHALGGVRYRDDLLVNYRQHSANASLTGKAPTRLQALLARLDHGGDDDVSYADCALRRAEILSVIRDREHRPELDAVAAMYRDLSHRYRRRAAVYLGQGIVARSAALVRSLGARDYGTGATKFEPASLVRDLWSGVVRHQRGTVGNVSPRQAPDSAT